MLVHQIEEEYQGAYAGLHGLASGTATHEVIQSHMARLETARATLIEQIGEEQAAPLIVKVMEDA